MCAGKRETALCAFRGEEAEEYPLFPITMMYAADLIGKPYREYATNAKVLAEGQQAMAERFGTSHTSVICDPCVESFDLGAQVHFYEDSPPANVEENSLLTDKSRLATVKVVDPSRGERMSNRLEGVRLLAERTGTERLVEGWVEGPCADIIGIGDAASSLIGPEVYREFILPRTRKYTEAIHEAGTLVRLHICGRVEPLYPHIGELKIDLIDVDSMNPLPEAREYIGEGPVICANLDPVAEVKNGTPEAIQDRLARTTKEVQSKFAVGAGCEIPRGTPEENLLAMRSFAESKGATRSE